MRITARLVALTLLFTIGSHAVTAELSKGIGPVKTLKLEEINAQLAKTGGETFKVKCAACHKMEERYVGPALKGVSDRRSPEWIMNMILNPIEMVQKDDTAKELLGEYLVQMTFQNVTETEARGILEYLRYYNKNGDFKTQKKQGEKK